MPHYSQEGNQEEIKVVDNAEIQDFGGDKHEKTDSDDHNSSSLPF